MRFSTLIFRNVFRRLVRSMLTMTGMAVAVGSLVVFVGLADGLSTSMLNIYANRHVALIVTRNDSFNVMSGTMPQKVGELAEKVDGVSAACLGLLELTTIEEFGSEPVTVQGWQPGAYMFRELKIVSGETLDEKSHGKHKLMIGTKIAAIKNIKVGDKLSIGTSDEKFEVAGIYESEEDIENGFIVAMLEDVQKIAAKPASITGCTLKVDKAHDNPAGIAAIAAEIEGPIAAQCEMKGKLRAKPPGSFVSEMGQLQVVTGAAWAISIVTLITSGIGVLNTMFMSVFERTREIGILRAIGWRPSRIMKMILMESFLLSIGGGVLGTVCGIGFILILSRLATVNGIVRASITPSIVMMGFVVAIVVGLIGAAWPAYRGSRLLPTEALRHE